MKIAYIASLYPAPSHTFIQREILELEALGVEIVRFSVRRPRPEDLLDETARSEFAKTRWLLPPPILPLIGAFVWMLFTRPRLGFSIFRDAIGSAPGWRAKLKWLAYFGEAVLLARWLVAGGVTHLHCHFGNAGSNTAWLAARLAQVGFSLTFHGIDLDEPDVFRHRDKLADARFAICISAYGQGLLRHNIAPADASKVTVIRCGFPSPDPHRLRPPPDAGRLICVARLSDEKGHGVLLDALELLTRRGVDFHCTLVGGGPLAEPIATAVAAKGLSGRVTLSGAVPNARVVEMIGEADISVLASFGEGIPIALLEALAQQRPVVATSVGGIPELVIDGQTGLLVPPREPVALADALQALIVDKELALRLAAAGRLRVAEMHDPAGAARDALALFQRHADIRGPRSARQQAEKFEQSIEHAKRNRP
ncbi:hypothetical protein VW29_16630 [Devosia limi DSM 17137]|uniref:Glycosyltransferase involved in cell wall bisynthesis n=1 Tax=Devosia limi DSM 17137 TaxID=1121477 RepID=A0A0F5LEL4_9HYPH|nr:glycosyltransferase family 4 protein [Devosia limi]KKB80634.1 hypothetical protein VW29_16630 [Devosia limi DSM 17137]SHE50129.1 Glycosyltransferase involved in cell wall bisynthesis [Devosia limi DSM 17137]